MEELQNIVMTLDIVAQSFSQRKNGKDAGSQRFKSCHLINGRHQLYAALSILLTAMLSYGYNAKYLLISSIVSIPNDFKSSLCNSDNYRRISLFNSICKVFDDAI